MTRIADFTKKYKDVLTKKESSYLTNFNFKTSNFYGLPKIHKSKLNSEAIASKNDEYIKVLEPIDLKVRPIVAGPMCPTRPLSALIDILLKPFVTHLNSYIRDNLDFLKQCSRVNSENTILVTFDVTSLYTNIPHDYGLQAIAYWIELYPGRLNLRFSKDFVLEGTKIILENNNCFFNNKYYNQIKGMAMGTIFAPTYATLTMGYLEIKFYQICELKWGKDTRDFIYKNLSRFLDDCETLLDTTKVKPEELLETVNSIHQHIQFTMEYGDVAIPLLDILIKRDKTKVWMDLYHKPTDTQRCLPFSSSHPNHCKRNIPFTLARRICTIVENQQQKLKHIHELKSNLKKYEYPETLIANGIQKALGISQETLTTPIEKNNKNVLPFIPTHNPNNPNNFHAIKSSINVLTANKSNGFNDIKIIHSRRQPRNLKRILTKAELSNIVSTVSKCGDTRCLCCSYLLLQNSYKFKNVNKIFTLT